MKDWILTTLRRLLPVVPTDHHGLFNYRLSREALGGVVKMLLGVGLMLGWVVPGLDPGEAADEAMTLAAKVVDHVIRAIESAGGLWVLLNGWIHVNRRQREEGR